MTEPQAAPQAPKKHIVGEDLLTWVGPNKPLYDFGVEEFKTTVKIAIFLGIWFILIKQFILVLVLLSLLFLIYVVIKAPVEQVTTTLKSTGIFSDGRLYLWENIQGFWFTYKGKEVLLYVDTSLRYPSRLTFILPKEDLILSIYQLLISYKPYRVYTEEQSWYQKLVDGTYIDIFDWVKEHHPELIEKGFREELKKN